MKRKLFSIIAVLVMLLGLAPAAVLAAPAPQEGFGGGGVTMFTQRVPINVVFLGYDKNVINQKAVRDLLPASYTPIVRYPAFYGLEGRNLGLKFDFNYTVTFVNQKTTDRFFKFLSQGSTVAGPTVFQTAYNDMENNILDVADEVLYADAPSVESWLNQNLNVNKKGYTIVFINWYGRPDFKFHVYTKTDVADPDTGYNFGDIRSSRKMIAWGGSSSRLWFYDLSAGPEAWTNNYDVDNPDLDGNGIEDYRMPPIWEYSADGYRDPSALSTDLGLVTRFVGINLLFTTSPLYDPLASAPEVNGSKIVHINMMEDDPASQGTDWINPSFAQQQFSEFQPYYNWQVNLTDVNPIDADAQRSFRIWSDLSAEDDCWNDWGTTFAQLFCYFDINRSTYIPEYGEADYVAAFHEFNTTADNLGSQYGLLGFADDNWIDGTPSYVFAFDTEDYRSTGYGFTITTIHEGGHHFGLSHPHDGYDSELGLDYGASDDFMFANSGDESNTIMHYMDLSDEFGQFDRDNMYRIEMAGYLMWSNSLMNQILANPNAASVRSYLSQAKNDGNRAVARFNQWNYLEAVTYARHAYEQLSLAAIQLGIPTPSSLYEPAVANPGMTAPHEGDPIRFPDN